MNLISESDSLSPTSISGAPDEPAAQYPRERIPKQPVLSLATFTHYSKRDVPSILSAGRAYHVRRGCMALGLALQHAEVGEGDEVLLPAYHCISMVEPVVWRGAVPVFYRVNADTSVDFDDIKSQITPNTRALLAAHYFGFPQPIARLRSFCDAHRLILIEDCAHAFFGVAEDKPIGSFGDYAIASTWKFFPVSEGGLLVSCRKNLTDLKLRAPGMRFQAKAVVNTLEQAHEYGRLPLAGMLLEGAMSLKARIHAPQATATSPSAPAANASAGSPSNWGFDAAQVDKKMSIASKAIVAIASKTRIADNRRRNYRRLLAELGALEGCQPLFPMLNDVVVPQVFPLFVHEPEPVFSQLKNRGVPIIRFGEFLWPDMPVPRCPVSQALSRSVFQFPCHQDLTPDELDWMIGCVREAFDARRRDKSPAPEVPTRARIPK